MGPGLLGYIAFEPLHSPIHSRFIGKGNVAGIRGGGVLGYDGCVGGISLERESALQITSI